MQTNKFIRRYPIWIRIVQELVTSPKYHKEEDRDVHATRNILELLFLVRYNLSAGGFTNFFVHSCINRTPPGIEAFGVPRLSANT